MLVFRVLVSAEPLWMLTIIHWLCYFLMGHFFFCLAYMILDEINVRKAEATFGELIPII